MTSSIDTLRQTDFIRVMGSSFMAMPEREALHILYAFDMQIAALISQTSHALIGMIRIEWWREALEGTSHSASPFIKELKHIIHFYHLDLSLFLEILDAREAELEDGSCLSLEAIEMHMKKTTGNILLLALQIITRDAADFSPLIFHTACAFALMRPFLYHNGNHAEDFLSQKWKNIFPSEENIQKITERAEYHVSYAKPLLKTLPKQHIPLFLPVLAAEFQIHMLKKTNYCFSPMPLQVKKTLLLCKIGWFMLWF